MNIRAKVLLQDPTPSNLGKSHMALIETTETREDRRMRQLRVDAIRERLAGSQIVVEDAGLVQERSGLWYHSFKPRTTSSSGSWNR